VPEHPDLLAAPDLRVSAVRCPGGHAWSPAEEVTRGSLVLVRRGVFVRRVGGATVVADVTTGYVQQPGEWQQVAHPAGGDVCTSIGVPGDLADRLAHAGPLTVTAAADLAHRRLAARTRTVRSGAAIDVVDLVAALVDTLLPASLRPMPAAAARAVDEVRAALHARPDLGLDELAGVAGWSPWYLSRTFRRVTGTTIGGYRRTLRVRAALDDLVAGTDDLATLAVRRGFADQAHMTRAMRREIDLSPAVARRLLRDETGQSR
jgi:AraC-like DNA-binding protein